MRRVSLMTLVSLAFVLLAVAAALSAPSTHSFESVDAAGSLNFVVDANKVPPRPPSPMIITKPCCWQLYCGLWSFRKLILRAVSGRLDAQPTIQWKHYWKECVGSGHALLALREDYRAHLEMARRDLGVKFVVRATTREANKRVVQHLMARCRQL